MKILFDHGMPFALAHGGFQIQIEQTKRALEEIGVEVEWLRWWDTSQRGDVIHFFGAVESIYAKMARVQGFRIVLSELRTGTGSRSPGALALQRFVTNLGRRFLPGMVLSLLRWNVYPQLDAAIALTSWEAQIMRDLSACPPERLHVVPNGVEEEFFAPASADETPLDWLICTATIHPRKRVLELAQAAVAAQTPVWIIGRPYSETESYHRAFLEIAQAHPQWVRYEGAIDDRKALAEIYRRARGFVLLSTMESQSLSALEAAACHCPLLLTDLPWARTTFAEHANYCPNTGDPALLAPPLRAFWEAKDRPASPFVPLHWRDVAERLRTVYASVLNTSR